MRDKNYPVFTHITANWEICQHTPHEYYAYRWTGGQCLHIQDEHGLDAVYGSFDQAKAAIEQQAQPINA